MRIELESIPLCWVCADSSAATAAAAITGRKSVAVLVAVAVALPEVVPDPDNDPDELIVGDTDEV